MARLSFLALTAFALTSFVAASPAVEIPLAQVDDKKWEWSSCGSPADPVQITSIDISPDPPQPGQDLTVTVVGEALQDVEDGAYADVTVKVGAIKLLHKEFDLCEEASKANVSITCPITKGTHRVTHTVALPKEIPPASFSVNVNGYTVDDEDMTCLNLKIDFRKRRW